MNHFTHLNITKLIVKILIRAINFYNQNNQPFVNQYFKYFVIVHKFILIKNYYFVWNFHDLLSYSYPQSDEWKNLEFVFFASRKHNTNLQKYGFKKIFLFLKLYQKSVIIVG